MKIKFAAAFVAISSLGLAGGACTTDGDIGDEIDEVEDTDLGEFEGMDPETTFFTRTEVSELPDGSLEVRRFKVSLAEQIAQREAEEMGMTAEEFFSQGAELDGEFQEEGFSAALTKQGSCVFSSSHLRMFSGTGYTGNELCLSGTGSSHLHAWSNCIASPAGTFCSFWGTGSPIGPDIPVHSYKTGQYNALFSGTAGFPCGMQSVTTAASTNVADASLIVEGSAYVARNSICTPP